MMEGWVEGKVEWIKAKEKVEGYGALTEGPEEVVETGFSGEGKRRDWRRVWRARR